MALRIGINGFGRIGRGVARAIAAHHRDVEIALINDLTSAETLAHLLKYDSVHGRYPGTVTHTANAINLDGREVGVSAEKEPGNIPWGKHGVSVVLECTGRFRKRAEVAPHLDAGASRVIISAPAKDPDATFAMGINHTLFDAKKHIVVSNASCTTNCLAPVAKVMHETFGIVEGLMTTIHSYTNDQRILDLPHEDPRRARAAALSMIPTSTGAASALKEVLPALAGKLDGFAIRVPTPNVSMVDLTVRLEKAASKDAINAAMRAAADGGLKGVLAYSDEPLVSIDYNGNTFSATVDGDSTLAIGHTAKVIAWYDNETGYSNRLVDLAKYISR